MSIGVAHAQGVLLAQVRPGVTTPVIAFAAGELRTEIVLIRAIPDSAQFPVIMRVYHDDSGGSTFDQSTIIGQVNYTALATQPARSNFFQAQHPGSGIMVQPGGEIAVAVDKANGGTFSIYGITETLAERVRPGVK